MLKGGGAASFGRVVEFTFNLRPAPYMHVFNMTHVLPLTQAADYVTRATQIARAMHKDLGLILYVSNHSAGFVITQTHLTTIGARKDAVDIVQSLWAVSPAHRNPTEFEEDYKSVADHL